MLEDGLVSLTFLYLKLLSYICQILSLCKIVDARRFAMLASFRPYYTNKIIDISVYSLNSQNLNQIQNKVAT